MILTKDMLTKTLKKGRLKAALILGRLTRAGGVAEPTYEYSAGGTNKYPSHFYKVKVFIPKFLQDHPDFEFMFTSVTGSGRCKNKKMAKSLAALEAMLRIEESMDQTRGSLEARVEEFEKLMAEKRKEVEAIPVENEIPGVSWKNLPRDKCFPEFEPAGRRGVIEFSEQLRANSRAFTAAKAMTLSSTRRIPEVVHHSVQTDTGLLQNWVNIKTYCSLFQKVVGPTDASSLGVDRRTAEIMACEVAYGQVDTVIKHFYQNDQSSFGMAKLFVELPKHQFKELHSLLEQVEPIPEQKFRRKKRKLSKESKHTSLSKEDERLRARIETFRLHQRNLSLPVDAVEPNIPHDAAVTIVRGGTGSGKTTRYPLMLSLFSPTGPLTKVVVAQPRRLACQTAAKRVATEQDVEIGSPGCPIGYAIRFEAFLASADSRTVDFLTPGVLLRRAMDDPLLRDITHLCIDEVHERNADMDLLLALAKQALQKRINHPTLPPLRVILMSATLDSEHWESYFSGGRGDKKVNVEVIDVPGIRRFPINIVHLDDPAFPVRMQPLENFLARPKAAEKQAEFDEVLCDATAKLVSHLIERGSMKNGSILCFLPGIEEIRRVDQLLGQAHCRTNVLYLHSSLSSAEQAKVFVPGPKVILSTNIAETSVTIPDIKFVIDSGRERQFSLLDSASASETLTVVGSQLATVNISRAAAKQRAGRAGRVSEGTCYRLYTRSAHDSTFLEFTKPEMLRMDLSQLVLHSLSLYNPESSNPLQLLLDVPDPPQASRLRQTLRSLAYQALIDYDPDEEEKIALTPLGRVVSALPASPRIGRMLIMGMALRAVDPALKIAALLSVPRTFQVAQQPRNKNDWHDSSAQEEIKHSSDLVMVLEAYQDYLKKDERNRMFDRMHVQFRQAIRVEQQLQQALKATLLAAGKLDVMEEWRRWNLNGHRVGALLAIICAATPLIAHLVDGRMYFATRDSPGEARIHPGSVNGGPYHRAHWYLYHEQRTTTAPYLHVTTAASPLELALFCEASTIGESDDKSGGGPHYAHYVLQGEESLFVVDQWIPVAVAIREQRDAFLYLRNLITNGMLQHISQDPKAVLDNQVYKRIVLFVLSALEQQRMK